MQSQNEAMNQKIEAKAQKGTQQSCWCICTETCNNDYYEHYCMSYILVTVPDGLRSIGASPQLHLRITNSLSETITVYWVNYSGDAVSYGDVPSGRGIGITTYGTHPWLITTTSDELIGYYVPLRSSVEITVK